MDFRAFRKDSFVSVLLVSVLFGFAAGAVGMLVAFAYALPEQQAVGGVSGTARSMALPAEDPAPAAELSRGTALFFDKSVMDRAQSGDPLRTLLPSEATGSGFVLTSDGWIAAHRDSFPKGHRAADAVVSVNGRVYAVRQVVSDTHTDALFLRVEASGLPVTGFGASDDVITGGSAFVFDRFGGLHRLSVLAHDDLAVANAADLRWSSERLQHVLHLGGAEGVLPGAMVLSRKGEIVGMFAGNDTAGAYAVPREAFSRALGGILKDGDAHRPYLGVRYMDRTRVISSVAVVRGALLVPSADGKQPAVARKSPAEAAGLRDGDVILALDGQDITANVALADLVAEYSPSDAVSLTVEREGKVIRVEATFGTMAK